MFPEPEGVLNSAPEIPGLDGRKMSKSYGNAISLCLTEEETAKLIKKSKTDFERTITFDKENRSGVSALLTTAALPQAQLRDRDRRRDRRCGRRRSQEVRHRERQRISGADPRASTRLREGSGLHQGHPARRQSSRQRDRQRDPRRSTRGYGDGVLARRELICLNGKITSCAHGRYLYNEHLRASKTRHIPR